MGKREILLGVLPLVLTLVGCGTKKAVVTESDSSFIVKERVVVLRDSVRWKDSTYYDTLRNTWHHERLVEKYIYHDVAKNDSSANFVARQPIIINGDRNGDDGWLFVGFFLIVVAFLVKNRKSL